MAEGRVGRRRERTRARLVQEAHGLMSRQGIDETTIQQITEAADVGFGTFYNYFPSKEAAAERVLDCVIRNLGLRNRLANEAAGVQDPLAVIANSVRLTAGEMRSGPIWGWWLHRTDLLARRMLLGFRPFGMRDMEEARAAGALHLPGGSVETGWSCLIWLLVGAVTDVTDGVRPDSACEDMAEAILRIMGASQQEAARIARLPLPDYPPLDIDYAFVLEGDGGAGA